MKRLLLRGYGEIPIKINPIGEQAVSYTHLDVYKRQENDLTCISFYAAECAEFPVMGEVHYDLTLPEALEAYEKIPSERMHGLKCVGFDLKDGSDYEGMQSLMIEGKIQKEDVYKRQWLSWYPDYRTPGTE